MISLKIKPTFRKTVEIAVPGDDAEPLRIAFEFKHMPKDEFKSFTSQERIAQREGKPEGQLIMEVASAWYDVDQPFTEEALNRFCMDYHGAGYAVISTYVAELSKVRTGN